MDDIRKIINGVMAKAIADAVSEGSQLGLNIARRMVNNESPDVSAEMKILTKKLQGKYTIPSVEEEIQNGK